MRRGTCILLATCVALRAAPAAEPAGEPVSAAWLAQLGATMGRLRTVQTAFVQEKTLRVLARPMEIRGKVYLAQPDRFAWHVAGPIRYTLLLQGSTVRQWDAESGSETRLSLDASPALRMATDQMRQWFSGDYDRLRSAYRITRTATEPLALQFVPAEDHPARGAIERVTVTFTHDARYLAVIDIVEQGGDRTLIRFHGTVLDGDIPDAAWDLRSETAAE